MPSFMYTAAEWAAYITGGLGVVAVALLGWRLAQKQRRFAGPVVAIVVMGALCAGCVLFLNTRVEQIRVGAVQQLGLETKHAGLRSNAMVYSIPVSVTGSLRILPSGFPGSGLLDHISSFLVHKSTTLDSRIAVYGLIDFATVTKQTATVNHQAKTITLRLPDPEISSRTTYIWSVDGVQQQSGLLNAVQESLSAPLDAIFGRPQVSFDARKALQTAEAAALKRARRSAALASCGKREITTQLTDEFRLTPAYGGYTVHVRWPEPPKRGVDCSALQQQLSQAGS